MLCIFSWELLNSIVMCYFFYRLLFHLVSKTEDEVFAVYFFFLLEAQFASHVIFIAHCSNSAPKSELLIFSGAFKQYLFYLSIRYLSASKKLTNLHSRNSFEMNGIIIICLFSWEWKYREIKARSDCGYSVLDIYHLSSVCPKYLALHSNLYI